MKLVIIRVAVPFKSGWPIVYMKKLQVIMFNIYHISFSVLTKSSDPDKMLHCTAFYLDLYCLLKYLLRGFWYTKVPTH